VGGGPDVEGETVFAGAGIVKDHIGIAGGLKAVKAEVVRGADALPLGRWLGWLPAKVAYRRCGEGDAFESDDFLVGGEDAFDFAFVGFYLERIGGVCAGDREKDESREKEFRLVQIHEVSPPPNLSRAYAEGGCRGDCSCVGG
jgi:hypothetical protein